MLVLKKRTIYITLLLIFIIGIVSIIGTFAIDTTITEGNSSTADYLFNIVLGNRTNREVVIPSYDSKIVDIKISNPNIFNMSYLLYLENTNSNISAINISDVSASGTIASGSANTIKVLIQNNGSSDTTINVRDIVGFESESLTLPSGGTSINTGTYYKVVVKSNNTSYGKVKPSVKLSTAGGTLKLSIVPVNGYKYASNTCGGTVSNNVLTLSNVSSNISCQVSFTVNNITVSFDTKGGDYKSNTIYTTSGEYVYTVPYTGTYQLETWGAQGGSVEYSSTTYRGGYGGYSTGNVQLTAGQKIYINVGGAGGGGISSSTYAGGYNGGGAITLTNGSDHYHASGGGATHIATKSGLLSTLSSNLSSILIVSGGGGGGYRHTAGTGYASIGGDAGGYTGGSATTAGSNGKQGLGGSQSAGGKYNGSSESSSTVFGSFGSGGTPSASFGSAGGGGYYGGGASYGQTLTNGNTGGGGGSGYIGNSLLTNKSMYCYNCTTSTATATKTYSTTNVSNTPTSNYAKSGDGAAEITYLEDTDFSQHVYKYAEKYGDLPTPTKKNYKFVGWSTDESGSNIITSDTLVSNNSDHTLYAIWKKSCSLPNFTYTGSYEIVDDDDNVIHDIANYVGNWKIRFLSSGSLTFTDLECAADGIDAFIVGGGGSGAAGSPYKAQDSVNSGGGGGGAAITVSKLSVSTGTSYSIVVASKSNSSFGVNGTAYFTALAGGTPVDVSCSAYGVWTNPIGSGGTGRLSTETSNYGAIGVVVQAGASGDGSNGNYEFNEAGSKRYGAGGSQGTGGVSTGAGGTADTPSAGGLDGGGTGGQGCSYLYNNSTGKYATSGGYAGGAATANSGSGGGGGGGSCGSGWTSYTAVGAGGAGSAGIVIIRNTRSNESNPPTGTLSVSNSYNTITASVNATDDTGIDHYEYYLSTSSTCPSSGYTKSNSNTYTFNLTNTGTYYVCTRVVDLLNNVLTLKSSSVSISRLYKVSIRYDTNGGTITASTGSNTWTTDSNGLIYRNGSIYEQTLYYENTIDLADYNNSSFINISTGDLYVVSGNEWVCLSGCSNVGKIYNQASSYSTSDFCDLTSGNCTVVLGLRLVEDIVAPTCTISASSSTITAVPADDKGVSKLKYYGWSSTYSGTNSTTKTISTGTHTYYVKDSSDNLGMCSITIESTVDGCTMSNYYLNTDRGKCVLSYAATPHAGGSCSCISQSTGSTNMVSGSCVISGSSAVCSNCPTNFSPSVSSCYIASYTCSSGDSLSGKWCLRYADIEKVCPSGYTKLDDNYCYK